VGPAGRVCDTPPRSSSRFRETVGLCKVCTPLGSSVGRPRSGRRGTVRLSPISRTKRRCSLWESAERSGDAEHQPAFGASHAYEARSEFVIDTAVVDGAVAREFALLRPSRRTIGHCNPLVPCSVEIFSRRRVLALGGFVALAMACRTTTLGRSTHTQLTMRVRAVEMAVKLGCAPSTSVRRGTPFFTHFAGIRIPAP